MQAVSERHRVATLLVALILVALALTVGVVRPTSRHHEESGPVGSVHQRCFWAVTIGETAMGYRSAPCNGGEPLMEGDPRYFCSLETLGGDPEPAPDNDLQNC